MELSSKQNTNQTPPNKGKKKMLMGLLTLFLIILLAGTGFIYRGAVISKWQAYKSNSPVEIIRFEGVEVNLADRVGTRYLRVSLVVEVQGKKAVQELEEKSYRVKDGIIKILRAKTVSELSTGTEVAKLKEDIISIINQELTMGKANSVYFEEFIIQ